MACRFTGLVIDCHDPEALASFWSEVLGFPVGRDEDDEDERWLEVPDGQGPEILFEKVPESKTVKNRLHIDLNPTDREQNEELERLLALGARKVDVGQGEQTWHVLADPEGNEFCLLRTRKP